MRIALAVAALLALAAAPSRAQGFNIRVSSAPTLAFSISSQTATSIAGGTDQGWARGCVQNVSTYAYVACSADVNVSTIASNANPGTFIPAAISTSAPNMPTCFDWALNKDFYCRTSAVDNTSRVIVVRER